MAFDFTRDDLIIEGRRNIVSAHSIKSGENYILSEVITIRDIREHGVLVSTKGGFDYYPGAKKTVRFVDDVLEVIIHVAGKNFYYSYDIKEISFTDLFAQNSVVITTDFYMNLSNRQLSFLTLPVKKTFIIGSLEEKHATLLDAVVKFSLHSDRLPIFATKKPGNLVPLEIPYEEVSIFRNSCCPLADSGDEVIVMPEYNQFTADEIQEASSNSIPVFSLRSELNDIVLTPHGKAVPSRKDFTSFVNAYWGGYSTSTKNLLKKKKE